MRELARRRDYVQFATGVIVLVVVFVMLFLYRDMRHDVTQVRSTQVKAGEERRQFQREQRVLVCNIHQRHVGPHKYCEAK